jgi:hypothetical protein
MSRRDVVMEVVTLSEGINSSIHEGGSAVGRDEAAAYFFCQQNVAGLAWVSLLRLTQYLFPPLLASHICNSYIATRRSC